MIANQNQVFKIHHDPFASDKYFSAHTTTNRFTPYPFSTTLTLTPPSFPSKHTDTPSAYTRHHQSTFARSRPRTKRRLIICRPKIHFPPLYFTHSPRQLGTVPPLYGGKIFRFPGSRPLSITIPCKLARSICARERENCRAHPRTSCGRLERLLPLPPAPRYQLVAARRDDALQKLGAKVVAYSRV